MPRNNNAPAPTKRELLIDRLYAEAKQNTTGSDEFKEAVRVIDILENPNPPEKKRWWIPSSDVVVTALASLGGILLILHAEHWKDQIVTSKAVGFVQKPR